MAKSYAFYDSGIEIDDVNKFTKITYGQITGITEEGEECILQSGEDYAVCLMRSEFTVGSYEDFAVFIKQKIAENENRKNNTTT